MPQCECGNPKRPGYYGCDVCREIQRQYTSGESLGESVRRRVLTALRFSEMDWLSAADLVVRAEVTPTIVHACVQRLMRTGEIESNGTGYRLKQRRAA